MILIARLCCQMTLIMAQTTTFADLGESTEYLRHLSKERPSGEHFILSLDKQDSSLSINREVSFDKMGSMMLRGGDNGVSSAVSLQETDTTSTPTITPTMLPTTPPTRRPTLAPVSVPTPNPTSSSYFNATNINRVATLYGTGSIGYANNGDDASEAPLSDISFMTFDNSKNIYFSDTTNNVIRMINGTTNQIVTIAGTKVAGNNGDGNAISTQLNYPTGLAFSSNGDLYFADGGNKLLRKLSTVASTASSPTSGVITTIANLTGIYYDPPSKNAATVYQYSSTPTYNLAFDRDNMLYIADRENCLIYNISILFTDTPSYTNLAYVSVFAGVISNTLLKPQCGNTGTGSYFLRSTLLDKPMGMAMDNFGFLYVADSGNNRVLKLSNGISSIVVGTGSQGYSGDGGPGMSA